MSDLGSKMAARRKDLGLTQSAFAEKLNVTRQTVSRWEAGTVMPDIEKISDIADILSVSCDYLLKDRIEQVTEAEGNEAFLMEDVPARRMQTSAVSRLLTNAQGRKVKLQFFDEEQDPDLYDAVCTIESFEGSWMKITAENRKSTIEKLVPLTSVLSISFVKEDA